MKKFMGQWIALLVILSAAWPALAGQKAELNLWKFDEFLYGSCGFCGEFVTLKEGRDLPGFTDFDRYFQSGYYTVVLKGAEDTTLTLFGSPEFATDRGFLILIKKDDALVEVKDLEAFPADTWVHVEAREGGSGGFKAYFHPSPQFKNNIASVKWGQWWDDLAAFSRPAT